LGHRDISGRLNKLIRLFLAEQNVEYSIPEKPNGRLQKYRLTERGKASLAALRKDEPPS
jgi:ATP-dependent DNA helicase RecG